MTQVIVTIFPPYRWSMGGLLGTRPARVTSEVQKTGPWALFWGFFSRESAHGRIFEWALLRGLPVITFCSIITTFIYHFYHFSQLLLFFVFFLGYLSYLGIFNNNTNTDLCMCKIK